jgi:hypothetical protein
VTSGTPTPPTADAGFAGLFVVTLSYGQTQIQAGQIAPYKAAPIVPEKLPYLPAGIQANRYTYVLDQGSQNNIIVTPFPAVTAFRDGLELLILPSFGNSQASVTVTVNGVAAPLIKRDGTALAVGDLIGGARTRIVFDGTSWRLAAIAASDIKSIVGAVAPTLPTANVVLNVSVNGVDATADGSVAKPFKTIIAAAMYASRRFVFAGYSLTIQLLDQGVYAAPGSMPSIAGVVTILGDPNNPSAYIVSGSGPASGSLAVIFAGSGCVVSLNGILVQNTGTINSTVGSGYGGTLGVQNCVISSAVASAQTYHIAASSSGGISIGANVSIQGSMAACIAASYNSTITFGAGWTVTILGNPNFSVAFCYLSGLGVFASAGSNGFSGSATGARYLVQSNSVAGTGGAGPNYFPGSIAGTTLTGGVYV